MAAPAPRPSCVPESEQMWEEHLKLVYIHVRNPLNYITSYIINHYDFSQKVQISLKNMPMVLQTWRILLAKTCSKSKIAAHLHLLYPLTSLICINVSGTLLHSTTHVTASKTLPGSKIIYLIIFNPLDRDPNSQLLWREVSARWRGKKWVYMASLLLIWLAERLEITTTSL